MRPPPPATATTQAPANTQEKRGQELTMLPVTSWHTGRLQMRPTFLSAAQIICCSSVPQQELQHKTCQVKMFHQQEPLPWHQHPELIRSCS